MRIHATSHLFPTLAYQHFVRLLVAVRRHTYDISWQLHVLLTFQLHGCQPVSNVLLVQTLLRCSNLVLAGEPKSRAIRSQNLVDENNGVIGRI